MNASDLVLLMIALFIVHSALLGVFVATIISLIFLPCYIFIIYTAWAIYFHITIDLNNSTIIKRRMFLGREWKKEIVTNRLDLNSLELLRTERSGMVRYMLTYHDLILVTSEEDYVALNEKLVQLQGT